MCASTKSIDNTFPFFYTLGVVCPCSGAEFCEKGEGIMAFDKLIFEDHFDVEIPNRDVWKMRKVKDVIDYMIKKGYTNV